LGYFCYSSRLSLDSLVTLKDSSDSLRFVCQSSRNSWDSLDILSNLSGFLEIRILWIYLAIHQGSLVISGFFWESLLMLWNGCLRGCLFLRGIFPRSVVGRRVEVGREFLSFLQDFHLFMKDCGDIRKKSQEKLLKLMWHFTGFTTRERKFSPHSIVQWNCYLFFIHSIFIVTAMNFNSLLKYLIVRVTGHWNSNSTLTCQMA